MKERTVSESSGFDIINDAGLNKSTSFSREERENLGLRGLLPYKVRSQEFQEQKILKDLAGKNSSIDKYIYLRSLENRNERLYYQVIRNNIVDLMPVIYTPTVGEACRKFAHIFRHTKGFYITPEDRGDIRKILDNWPYEDVRVIVITDGERILGLGDLGANGMGIPIGKLDLYIAGGGIEPRQCLPVMLDVGTNNRELLNDPLYLGWPHERLRGSEYLSLVEEFVYAIQDKFPKSLIQFEDFATPNAYSLLKRFRNAVLSFNDDIQGTAAVVVAGIKAATRLSGTPFSQQRIVFLGAGSAATGIASLLIQALISEGLTLDEAKKRVLFVDEKGTLVKSRTDLSDFNRDFAVDGPAVDFIEALENFKPHALVGATGAPGTFSREIIEKMSEINDRPVIFPLSNPTDSAECTAEQAITWSGGRVIFASGSPFSDVNYEGKLYQPAQGNNSYIFPGVGLGAIAVSASRITDSMLLAAAECLSLLVDDELLQKGVLYPPLNELPAISLEVAVAVAENAYEENLATMPRPSDLREYIASLMYSPKY